jgi:hypothetical protein
VPAAEVEPSFLGQHAVRLRDGVVMNPEIDGELTDRGERVADRKSTGNQQRADGIRDLPIRGDRGGEIDPNDGSVFHCLMSTDNIHEASSVATGMRVATGHGWCFLPGGGDTDCGLAAARLSTLTSRIIVRRTMRAHDRTRRQGAEAFGESGRLRHGRCLDRVLTEAGRRPVRKR